MPVTTRQAAHRQRQRHVVTSSISNPRGCQAVKTSKLGRNVDHKERARFGLVQEIYQHNLYYLIVQAILWNQTRGKQAILVLRKLLQRYPDPLSLASAVETDLVDLLQPIGLHRLRAKRLISLGQIWVKDPPDASHVFKVRYKCSPAEAYWEIAHLPGIGKYAIDSYRIFHRDQLRGFACSWDDHLSDVDCLYNNNTSLIDPQWEPEWKRVVPTDKDLRAFLKWAWLKEGYEWDSATGQITPSLLPCQTIKLKE